MTGQPPETFRSTRIFGGTQIAEQVLAWAGSELTRRQQNPCEGDESRSERWGDALAIYVEDMDLLSDRGMAHIQRLARDGRRQGIVITVRVSPKGEARPRPWERQWKPEQLGTPTPFTLSEIRQMCADMLAEMEERGKKINMTSTKKGIR